MKKTLISALILSTLAITGCEDKESQAQIQQLQSTITQLQTDNANLQKELTAAQNELESTIPAIVANKEVLFEKTEKMKSTGEDVLWKDPKISYQITTQTTNLDWLNTMLLEKLSENTEHPISDKQKLIEAYNKNFDGDKKESNGEYPIEFKQSFDFIGQRGNIATFTLDNYLFSGGAHGSYGINYYVVDLKNQKWITLDDVFLKDKLPEITKQLNEEYMRQQQTDTPYVDKVEIPQNFYFTPQGITFVYQPYEIGPYAEGVKELSLYWFSIRDFVKPEFKEFSKFEMTSMDESE